MEQIKKQSIANNFVFQFLYQTWLLIIPLIIAPYLTRVLGDTALGIFTYVNSVAYYFILFANLGISRYGQRVIAKSNNMQELRVNFWSLFVTHFFFSIVSFGVYLFSAFYLVTDNKSIFLIESIYVLSAVFDITWLFFGLENFKSIAVRNFLIKAIELICVFVFVRTPDDLPIYTLITACAWLFGQAIMIPQAIAVIKPVSFGVADVKKHLKPLFVFFISTVAISLYTVFDKTLLGILSTKENVAYYEYANKIISIPRTFIAVIGTVLFPRACKLVKEGNEEAQVKYLNISLVMVSFIGAGSLFGLLAVAQLFSVVFYGEAFVQSGYIMMGMACLPLICGLGEIVRAQYMIPNGMDKEYTICIIINAVINLCISTALIPFLGAYGAVLGTCAAEIFGCFIQIYICRRFIMPKLIFKETAPFLLIGLIMFLLMKFTMCFIDKDLFALIITIFVGVISFAVLTLLYFCIVKKVYWEMVTGFMKKFRRK